MDIELARHLARVIVWKSSELGDLLPFLKQHLPEEEYKPYALGIASGIATLGLEVLNRLIAEHPSLQAEIDDDIKKFGKFL